MMLHSNVVCSSISREINYFVNFAILALLFANLSIKSSVFICFAHSFSIARRARPSSRSCEIVDLRYVFMIFNLEKERSALATVTGRVANSTQAVANSGIDDVMSELIMTFSMSNTEFVASSS